MDGDNELAVLLAEGNDLLDRGEPQAAIATFQRCHTPRPDHGGILFNLANAQLAARRLPDAVDTLVACLRCSPDFGPAYIGLADTLRRLTLLGHAQQMAETAVRLLPGRPAALLALANVLHDRTDYAGAADLYVRALTADPDDVGALTSLGNTLRIMGRIPEALAMQDRAVALAAGEPEIRFNRALARLAAGDYASGWEEYEFRWHRPGIRPRDIGPLWDGGCVAGRTVLLHAEQGLGDTLQFIRYADILRERGAQVVLEVQAELARLVRESMPFATVVTRGEALPHFDVHCPMLSMPRLMRTRLETVPASLPYLRCDRDRVESWRCKLPDNRPLLGLVWAGGAHPDDAGLYLIDQRRSLRPADLGPLAEIAGVHWVSLQKGRTERPFAMLDLMYEVEDFADTAALVANLDLVVAVDTSVATLRRRWGARCGCCRVTMGAGAGCMTAMTVLGIRACGSTGRNARWTGPACCAGSVRTWTSKSPSVNLFDRYCLRRRARQRRWIVPPSRIDLKASAWRRTAPRRWALTSIRDGESCSACFRRIGMSAPRRPGLYRSDDDRKIRTSLPRFQSSFSCRKLSQRLRPMMM